MARVITQIDARRTTSARESDISDEHIYLAHDATSRLPTDTHEMKLGKPEEHAAVAQVCEQVMVN